MISQTLTHLAVLPMQTVENPFDGLTPDFLSLGGTFEAWWQRLFVALWGLAIIVAAVYLQRTTIHGRTRLAAQRPWRPVFPWQCCQGSASSSVPSSRWPDE